MSQRPPLRLLEIALLLVAIVVGRGAAQQVAPISDETAITWRYAENLAAGEGLVFNPGAAWEPVLGTASPGYAVLLAPLLDGRGSALRMAPRLNLVLDLLTALLLVVLLRERPRLLLCALALFAAHPGLALASAGGTESAALVLIGVATSLAVARGAYVLAGVLAGLAVALRIEAAMLLPVALGLAAGAPRRRLLAVLVPALIVLGAFGTWLVERYGGEDGTRLPLAYLARLFAAREWTFGACLGAVLRGALLPALWALPFTVLGLGRLLRIKTPLGVPAATLFGLLTLPVAVIMRVQPHDPLYAVTWAALVFLVADLCDSLVPRVLGTRPVLPAALLSVAAALCAVVGTWAANGDDVRAQLQAWSEESGFADSALVLYAGEGAGLAAYACGGIVLDARGRTWPAGLAEDDAWLIANEHPDYLLLDASRGTLAALRADDELARGYYPVRRFSALGATELEPETEALPVVAHGDWLLFRRGL